MRNKNNRNLVRKAKKNRRKRDWKEIRKRLKDLNLSEEKAKMVLDAMRNQEIQFLQQQQRKAKKRQEKGKPDW